MNKSLKRMYPNLKLTESQLRLFKIENAIWEYDEEYAWFVQAENEYTIVEIDTQCSCVV